MSNDQQGEYINVVFDNQFQNFESELGTMSLEKMMNISYSEEILQKNFSVIIGILKQLYRGQIDLTAGIKENKEWVQKLKEITNTNSLRDKVEANEQKTNNNIIDLQKQMDQFVNKQKIQDDELTQNKDLINQQQGQINNMNKSMESLRSDLDKLNHFAHDTNSKLNKHETEQKQIFLNYDQKIQDIMSEIDALNQKSTQLTSAITALNNTTTTHTTTHSVGNNQNIVTQNTGENSTIDNQNPIQRLGDSVPEDLDAYDDFRRRLQKHEQEIFRLNELFPRVQTQEEEVQRIYDRLDAMRSEGSGGFENGNNGSNDDLKAQVNILQNQVNEIQTQMNLMGAIGGGENMGENQLSIILQEISKSRSQFLSLNDYQSDQGKLNGRFKNLEHQVSDGNEKIRRELTLKINQKLDVTEALKIVNEINFLKEQMQQVLNQKSNGSVGQQQNNSNFIDPNISNKIRDLQDQVHNLENEVKNHRIQSNTFINSTNVKIGDIDKKLQSLQLDRIFSEMQLLREISDQIKKDCDSNIRKVKEIRKIIDTHVTKEDLLVTIEQNLKPFRDDLNQQLRTIEDSIKQKAELEDLSKVEQNMLSKLEEIVQALIKQLANKQETKKALIYLEQKINQIFVILEGDGAQKDGDGLFTKRPLLWSCASCDKDLDKFKGQLGDYRGWAIFPPKETSPERMGRFGVGFKNQQDKTKIHRERLEKEKDRYIQQDAQNISSSKQPNKTQGGDGFYHTQLHHNSGSNLAEHLPKINQKSN